MSKNEVAVTRCAWEVTATAPGTIHYTYDRKGGQPELTRTLRQLGAALAGSNIQLSFLSGGRFIWFSGHDLTLLSHGEQA
jgi:hypothetical protein